MEYFILSVSILLLGALLSLIIKEDYKVKLCSLLTLIAGGTAMIPAIQVLMQGSVLSGYIKFSSLIGKVDFTIDALSAFFIIIISIMSFLTTIYANGYLKPYINKGMNISSHCFFFMLLIASMLGVVTIHNSLFFLIIWEVMSLSSFFLVIFENEKKGVLKSGLKYLVYMHLSIIFIMTMFAILTNSTGSFAFADYARYLQQAPQMTNLIFILGFIGFGIKAGLVPFHNWLPDAHPAAPTHVSSIMSGVMIKTGIYGILRILLLAGYCTKTIGYVVLVVGVISLLYGILYAITQKDLKKLLAYSSIENIGIMTLGLGVGILGLAYQNKLMAILGLSGCLLHVLNHSIFKELMFFASGSVYLKTHTRNMEELGGLIKKMPITAILFIFGSVAICGLPPFNGFISEVIIYAGMLLGIPASEINLFVILVISIAALALVGTMAVLCFSKAAGITFLGEARTERVQNIDSDSSALMLVPMGFLLICALLIGLFPQYILRVVFAPVSLFTGKEMMLQNMQPILAFANGYSILLLSFVALIIVILAIRFVINRRFDEHTTWGCGYNKPNSHIQYTASSYVNLFVATLKPLFKRVSHVKKPKDLFPKDAYYEQEIEDIEEAYLVKPIVKWDEKILTKFERIQNGNIQQYILFGLIFLVIALVGAILK